LVVKKRRFYGTGLYYVAQRTPEPRKIATSKRQDHIINNATEDPFCGSGSTLVAARQLRRHFLGIELDGQYHAIASQRLQREAA
jgi:hypothetical protein